MTQPLVQHQARLTALFTASKQTPIFQKSSGFAFKKSMADGKLTPDCSGDDTIILTKSSMLGKRSAGHDLIDTKENSLELISKAPIKY